jgi:hypothetical protein
MRNKKLMFWKIIKHFIQKTWIILDEKAAQYSSIFIYTYVSFYFYVNYIFIF